MLYGPRSFAGTLIVPQATSGLKYGLAPAPHGPWFGGVKPAPTGSSRDGHSIWAPRPTCRTRPGPSSAGGRGKRHSGPSSRAPGTAQKGPKLTFPNMPPPARRSVAQSVAPWFGGEPIVAALEHARDLPLHPLPTGSWTWDELLQYVHALTQPQGVYGFGLLTGAGTAAGQGRPLRYVPTWSPVSRAMRGAPCHPGRPVTAVYGSEGLAPVEMRW